MTFYEWLVGWEMRQKARRQRLKELVALAKIRAVGKKGDES